MSIKFFPRARNRSMNGFTSNRSRCWEKKSMVCRVFGLPMISNNRGMTLSSFDWLSPLHFVQSKPLRKSLERDASAVDEVNALAGCELAHDVRDQDLVRLGAGADACRRIDGGAEQLAVGGEWLAGVDPDTNPQRGVWVLPVVRSETPLDRHGAVDRGAGRRKGHHHPVASITALGSTVIMNAAA